MKYKSNFWRETIACKHDMSKNYHCRWYHRYMSTHSTRVTVKHHVLRRLYWTELYLQVHISLSWHETPCVYCCIFWICHHQYLCMRCVSPNLRSNFKASSVDGSILKMCAPSRQVRQFEYVSNLKGNYNMSELIFMWQTCDKTNMYLI